MIELIKPASFSATIVIGITMMLRPSAMVLPSACNLSGSTSMIVFAIPTNASFNLSKTPLLAIE